MDNMRGKPRVQAGALVVVNDVRAIMAGRGDHLDDAAAEIDLRLPLGPGGQVEKLLHAVDIERRDLHAGKAGKLHVAIAMVGVAVSVDDQQRKLPVAALRQQSQHGFRYWHCRRISDGAGVDQQRFLLADQQEKKISFGAEAQILPQDVGLWLVLVHLQGRLRIRLAIRGARIPAHVQRAGNQLLRVGGRSGPRRQHE